MILNKERYLSILKLLIEKINNSGGDFEEKQINRYGDYGSFRSKSSPDFLLRFSFSLEMNNRGIKESFFLKIWFGNKYLLDFFDYKNSGYKYFFHSHNLDSLELKVLEFDPNTVKLRNGSNLSDAWLFKERSLFLDNKKVFEVASTINNHRKGDYKAIYSDFKSMRKEFEESQSERMLEAVKRITICIASVKLKLFNLSYFKLNEVSSDGTLFITLPNNRKNKGKVSKLKEMLLINYSDIDKSLSPLKYEGLFTPKRNTRIRLKILSESPRKIRKLNKAAKKEL